MVSESSGGEQTRQYSLYFMGQNQQQLQKQHNSELANGRIVTWTFIPGQKD